MVAPSDQLKITLVDLSSSGQEDTVVSIFTDLNGFWSFENREVLVVDNGDGAENTEL